MRWRVAFCVGALALAGMSCEAADDEPEASPIATAEALESEEFTLTGVVIDAKEGVEPPDAGDDLTAAGGIAIRPDADAVVETAGLEGCEMTQDAYVAYYTPDTDAAGLEDDDAWPETLEGRSVTVEGMRHETADDADEDADASPDLADDDDTGCVLLVEMIRPAQTTTDDTDTGMDGGQTTNDDGGADATGSPEATDEDEGEVVWPTPADFPDHEDTDPVFEGTPSPDPCEGQKACEEKREEGEIE